MKFFLSILLLFGFQASSFGQVMQKTYFHKKSTIVRINPLDNSFTQDIHHQGVCPPNQKERINIYFGELDQLDHLRAYYSNAKGKQKSIKKKQISKSSALSRSFYSGIQKLSFFFEAQDQAFPFEYSYQKTTSDLMFLSKIALPQQAITDTFYYELILPENYTLSYQLDSLYADFFSIQTLNKTNATHYIFSSTQQQRLQFPKKLRPEIRLLVYTKNKAPEDYFNDWYFDLVKPHSALSKTSLQEILSQIPSSASARENIAAVFNFIKEKISYIDFENGIGAVQPRDVNQVLLNKQGDCKDMSNLLCQSLKQMGFKAYLAISSTLSHPYDLTFPSLASADHVICVVDLDGEWLFLDATEDYGLFGLPSRQIQDKHIFIINEDRGLLKKVEKVAPQYNTVFHQLTLSQQQNKLQGKGRFNYHGLSQIDWQFLQNYTSKEKLNHYLYQSLESKFSNTSLSDIQLQSRDSLTQIDYHCSIEKSFTNIKEKTYLSLAFLPAPHDFPSKLPEEKSIVLYETQHRQLELRISLEEACRLQNFEPITFAENGFRFQLTVKQINSKELQLQYLYENEHVQLVPALLPSYNKVNQLIQESLQKSIIYEKIK